MKQIKVKVKFTVSDEFYRSAAFQDFKESVVTGEVVKDLEIEGDVMNMKMVYTEMET